MTKWIVFCVGILLLVVPVACASGPQVAKTAATPPMSVPTPAPNTTAPRPLQTGASIPGPLPKSPEATVPHVIADGRLSFVKDIELTFGTSGRVAQVNVSELDKVTKGQVLAKLDTTSLEQAVKAAEITLRSAESDRELAKNGIRSAELDNETVQANVKAAEIDLEQAQDNLREITYPYTYFTVYLDVPEALGFINGAKLEINKAAMAFKTGQSGEVSSQLQQALDSLTEAQDQLARRGYGNDVFASQYLSMDKFWTLRAAQLQADRDQLAVENAKNAVNKTAVAIENAKTAFDKAQLAVDKANNDLSRARDELQKAVITAPFDGVIAAVNVKELDLLSSVNYATTIAIEIIDPSHMELDVKVNELDIANVKLGQKVTISVDALPDERFDSVVTSISSLPVVESGMVSYEIKVAFDVPKNSALKAGMHAKADIIVDKQ